MRLPAILSALTLSAAAAPLFSEDFEKTEIGKLPAGFTAFAGAFKVAEDGGQKFLELPGAPLDSFGVLFGPAEKYPLAVGAKIFGTGVKRKVPAFGVSLGGVGGYRLQVSAAKGTLEIFKADEPRASSPFSWKSGAWTALRLQVREVDGRWLVEGKAWPADAAEPAAWALTYEAPEPPPTGKAGVWGNPFSGTPIRFDELTLSPAR
jgi:hypothetical protein